MRRWSDDEDLSTIFPGSAHACCAHGSGLSIGSLELLEHLLPMWWGGLYCDLGFEISGHKINHESRLGRAAKAGQISECVRLVREAGEAGSIEGLVPISPADQKLGQFNRITPADWSALEHVRWIGDLLDGVFIRFDEPLAWAHLKPIMFRKGECETWLRGLTSPHLLFKPLMADPAILPDRDYVTLSETVSWLAFLEVMDCSVLVSHSSDGRDRVLRYAEDPDNAEPEEKFGLWFAGFLAGQKRQDATLRAVQHSMAKDDLVGRGRCQNPKGASEIEEISSEVFLQSVHLVLEIDGIGVDPRAENPDSDAAENGANWKNIRFARHHLERLWGKVNYQSEALATESLQVKPKGGRPVRNDAVLEAFDRFAPSGKVESVTWRILAQRISKDVGWEISPDALQAAVRRRANCQNLHN